jgi:hypothetical protein
MKLLKICSYRALGCEGAKNSGFFRLHLILRGVLWEHILRKELFCQTVYQNGSSSTDRAVYGAKTPKNSFTSEVESCQIGPKEDYLICVSGLNKPSMRNNDETVTM